ncbi:hypothetical protein H6504_04955 [Candidatus Woesearchaeota archaeon]|nr:hypothetical protein [Candidatus Woesearchaeota archaeon]
MKKGSLQLSINAIVVLILAITILGLGLGFIKSQFDTATQNFGVADQELAKQITDELESSGKLLTLKKQEFEVKSGDPEEFFFGIRNTDTANQWKYYIQFQCISTASNPTGCDNWDADGDNQWDWFKTFTVTDIDAASSKAIFANLLAQSATETYNGKLTVYRCTTAGGCPADLTDAIAQLGTDSIVHDTKVFTIRVI